MSRRDLNRLDPRCLLRRRRRSLPINLFSFQPPRPIHHGLAGPGLYPSLRYPIGLPEHVWDPVFEIRRPFDIVSENTPYIEILDRWDGLEDAVQEFVRGRDDMSERFETMVRDFKAFCAGASIEGLETGKDYASTSKALLDDKCIKEGKISSRPYLGLLTPRDLYRELRKKVGFPSCPDRKMPAYSLVALQLCVKCTRAMFRNET